MSQARFSSLRYIVFISLLIGACASFSATGRITGTLMASLALAWCWVPVLHVVVARAVAGRRADILLSAHAPWSIWLIAASAGAGLFGFAAYGWMVWLALLPIAITARIVYVFCRDVLNLPPRPALRRTLLHQGITWFAAAIYLDRAVSLWPRILGMWL